MFTEKEMSDALKWLFDLFQPEDYEAYDEEEVGCAALCLPEVCMALRDKAETPYEYVVKPISTVDSSTVARNCSCRELV